MKVHFIAIGGSAMHNLAIAMHKKGYQITGSDDEIFEPSRSRLDNYGLLPENIGWNAEILNDSYDAIILGMHARENNPELKRAQELGLKIYSYPEYLYEQSKDKCRIVIGGSHGKTTITAMILHVFQKCSINTDYMVGAQLEGFEVMVKLTDEAKYMVLEGDEYLTSPIDRRPKFHLYKPNIALISGIAWDHINVFPTYENYAYQFERFIELIEDSGCLIYCADDTEVDRISQDIKLEKYPYKLPENKVEQNQTKLYRTNGEVVELNVFGDHNLRNIEGARNVCNRVGICDDDFYEAISSFKGASNRLQKIGESKETLIYKDFAHSPSKLNATTKALKDQYPERRLIACMELHTFSSLNKSFLDQYEACLDHADVPVIYFSEHALKHKKLPELTSTDVIEAFKNEDLKVFTETDKFVQFLSSQNLDNSNVLLMTSGNFGGLDLAEYAKKLLG